MTVIRELVARLGFDVNDKGFVEFDEKVKSLKTNLGGLTSIALKTAAAIAGSAGTMLALTVSTTDAIKTTDKLSKQLGVSAIELDNLEKAAQAFDFKTGEMTNALLRFDTVLGQAKISIKGTSNEFRALGITLRDSSGNTKSTVEVFKEASRALLNMQDPAKKAAISYRLFGTANLELAKFMGQNSKELDKYINSVRDLRFELTDKSVEASKKFTKSWKESKVIFKSIKDEIALQFVPAFDELLTRFKEWFGLNKDIIRQNISDTVGTLTKGFGILTSVLGFLITPIVSVIDALGGLQQTLGLLAAIGLASFAPQIIAAANALRWLLVPALQGFAMGIWAVTAAMLANPATGMLMILARLAVVVKSLAWLIGGLLVEALGSWVAGNDSIIGRVLGSWEDFKTKILGIGKAIATGLAEALGVIGDLGQAAFDKLIGDPAGKLIDKVKSLPLIRNFNKSKPADLIKVEIKDKSSRAPNVLQKQEIVDNKIELVKRPKRKIELIDESNLDEPVTDFKRPKRKIELIDESNLDEPVTDFKRTNPLNKGYFTINDPKVDFNNPLPINNNNITNNASKPINNIHQNITENINITVPEGTSAEQAEAISAMVSSEMQTQFDNRMIAALDSISMR